MTVDELAAMTAETFPDGPERWAYSLGALSGMLSCARDVATEMADFAQLQGSAEGAATLRALSEALEDAVGRAVAKLGATEH